MTAPLAVRTDGSARDIEVLTTAIAAALEGGPPVLPHGPGAAPPAAAPTTAAVVIATSGSTGEPKLVALSAAALRASAQATAERLGGPGRWLLALPAEHVAGVQVIVRALLAGVPPGVQDLRAGFRPAEFAAATDALGSGRRYTSLVPTQLLRVLDDGGAALEALLSFDAVLVGGAALEAGLRARALDAGARVVTTYGMSETCGGCVYDGVPLDRVIVELDEDGRVLLGGPTLADGYLGRPTEGSLAGPRTSTEGSLAGPRTSAEGSLAGPRTSTEGSLAGPRTTAETADAFVNGRFRTGDLGRWRDGRLEILGRADDMIITGGEKVAPAAVERVLAAQPGVSSACVVGLPDPQWGQVVAAAVVWREAPGAEEPLRAAVRAELGRAAVPRRIVPVAEIPVRGIGKPDRRAVAELVAAAHPCG